jgi:Flp pilus assembly protein TadG
MIFPRLRRFGRATRAAAIVEFALVVPIFFLVVWGAINFSRGYQRLNTLSLSLREGARHGATLQGPYAATHRDAVKAKVFNFATAYGFPIDTSQVTVVFNPNVDVQVRVVNYPLFAGLSIRFGLSQLQVSRTAIFRLEWS